MKKSSIPLPVCLRIEQIELPSESVILVVIRKDEVLIPHGSLVLQQNDEIIALVHVDQLKKMEMLLNSRV